MWKSIIKMCQNSLKTYISMYRHVFIKFPFIFLSSIIFDWLSLTSVCSFMYITSDTFGHSPISTSTKIWLRKIKFQSIPCQEILFLKGSKKLESTRESSAKFKFHSRKYLKYFHGKNKNYNLKLLRNLGHWNISFHLFPNIFYYNLIYSHYVRNLVIPKGWFQKK